MPSNSTKMSLSLSTDELSLALLNAQINGSSGTSLAGAISAWVNRTEETSIGVCGTPCAGNCQTCTQSEADLQAFFATEVSATQASMSDEVWEELQQVARARDEAEEAVRTGMIADTGEDYDGPDNRDLADDESDDGYRGCQCLDCLNHDNPDYVPSYDDYDDRQDPYYDNGCGLDWNESGYFD